MERCAILVNTERLLLAHQAYEITAQVLGSPVVVWYRLRWSAFYQISIDKNKEGFLSKEASD